MAENKQSSQSRFLIAIVLSMAILTGWSYFFAPKKTDNANANTNANTAVNTPQIVQNSEQQTQQTQQVEPMPDNVPQKSLTVASPLYKVKLDSKGALATSWVLFKSSSPKGEKILYADGSNEAEKKELELIPAQASNSAPHQIPFRIITGDANLDNFINERNYQVSIPDENIQLNGSDSKQVDYILRDEANGLEVVKSFVFRADNYVTDLSVKVLRNGQPVPNVKLAIGASIGDQGIQSHGSYHIEPEAVIYTNGGAERHSAASLVSDKNPSGVTSVGGNVDWVGIGDTYFAMAAIPSQPVQGTEIHAAKYEAAITPFYNGIIDTVFRTQTTKETRYLVSAYIPIYADGSKNLIYTGTKDYFVLSHYNEVLTNAIGRHIDIEDFINFSNYSILRPIFKPISIVILYCLNFINSFAHAYGISIIIFTILFYSLLFPMRWYQSRSFKKAQKNAPKMKELQDKLKELQKKGVPMDDPRMREVQMEQLKMTKDAIPIGGCLPMLLQMPLLIALYTAVTISIDFRQERFLWLPDLSTVDPYYVLPFLFAGSMFLSMKFSPTTPTVTPEQQMQQKLMTFMMPLMMLWIGWTVPSGLLVYWVTGNIVGFIQQVLINKLNKTGEPTDGDLAVNSPKLSAT